MTLKINISQKDYNELIGRAKLLGITLREYIVMKCLSEDKQEKEEQTIDNQGLE